jgi:hypothetical protein
LIFAVCTSAYLHTVISTSIGFPVKIKLINIPITHGYFVALPLTICLAFLASIHKAGDILTTLFVSFLRGWVALGRRSFGYRNRSRREKQKASH